MLNHSLHESASIFTIEVRPILKAMNKLKSVIVIDSLWLLKTIRNPSISSRSVIKLGNTNIICGDRIETLRVPGHIGWLGNEQADRAAESDACTFLIMDDIMEKLNH